MGLCNMCNIAHVKLIKISKFLLKTTIIYWKVTYEIQNICMYVCIAILKFKFEETISMFGFPFGRDKPILNV